MNSMLLCTLPAFGPQSCKPVPTDAQPKPLVAISMQDKTLALLLPGSGGAALIFDGRIDYFAMAAIPAVWQLYKAGRR